MMREKFPERIPFRLTRMLTRAMEVSGIEGSFRTTCEISMKVLRDNKESVLAVLEAFVYDPLISWRLLNSSQRAERLERKSVFIFREFVLIDVLYIEQRIQEITIAEQPIIKYHRQHREL